MDPQRLRDSWQKRLAQLATAWPAAAAGDVDGVHDLRVASRRLRETVPLMTSDPRARRRARRRLRTLTRGLGPVRERDVSLALLSALEQDHPELGGGIGPVRRHIAGQRAAFLKRFPSLLRHSNLERFMGRLSLLSTSPLGLGDGPSPGAAAPVGESARSSSSGTLTADGSEWRVLLAGRVAKRSEKVREAVEEAGALYSAERLHRVRVATKKLRYAVEIGRDVGMSGWPGALRNLKAMQETLGDLQDLAMLLGDVREIEASSAGTALAELERLSEFLEAEARQHHATFLARRARLLRVCATVRRQASAGLPLRLRPQTAGHVSGGQIEPRQCRQGR